MKKIIKNFQFQKYQKTEKIMHIPLLVIASRIQFLTNQNRSFLAIDNFSYDWPPIYHFFFAISCLIVDNGANNFSEICHCIYQRFTPEICEELIDTIFTRITISRNFFDVSKCNFGNNFIILKEIMPNSI